MKRVVLFAGAPTGGHYCPGVAVAKELEEAGVDCEFVTSGRPLEDRILEHASLVGHPVAPASPRHPLRTLRGLGRVRRLLRERNVVAVVGLGGAASLLPGWAAMLSRIPVFLLEQNRVVGRANRLLVRGARRLFLTYTDTQTGRAARSRAMRVGCPVRASFRPQPAGADEEPTELLVLGGSQGAQSVNDLVPRTLSCLTLPEREFRVHHVTGAGGLGTLKQQYEELGVASEVVEYVDDPGAALARASLVLGRAGGSTLAELTAVGRGALLIPYPHHRDRQQFLNAEFLEAAGAARVVAPEPEVIAQALREVLLSREAWQDMGTAARQLGAPHAARDIAIAILTHLDAVPTGFEEARRWALEGAS